ncbi:GNAT family N-acetyltransferase [Isoptericola halotolerans]|uniref:GNAT family N-acetyltransferase n=1 Tax=Isoptericola halotolerans TaxID=300560 RepID=UPI00389035C3
MTTTLTTPAVTRLDEITTTLSGWQTAGRPGFLHPGDLGWHSTVTVREVGRDLTTGRVLPSGTVTVEARGALALRARLRAQGWDEDEPWTPLRLDLRTPVRTGPRDAVLRVEEVGPDAAAEWTAVHRSAFRRTTPSAGESRALVRRWTTMATAPFAHLAHHLVGYDATDRPVAVTTVWTAGGGRPGLVEPMGVHRDHHGHGYGTAVTLAGARVLQQHGASAAAVVAENSNTGALATYLAAGFTADEPVADLTRSSHLA